MSCYPAMADSKLCWHQDGENNAQEKSETPSDSKMMVTGRSQERSVVEASNGSTSDPKQGTIYKNDANQSDKTEVITNDRTTSISPLNTVSASTISQTTELLASTTLIDRSVIISPHDVIYEAESTFDTGNIVNSVHHNPPSPTILPSVVFSEFPSGDAMAFDPCMRGDYSTGQVLPEYLPQPLKIPLKAVAEEEVEIGISELEDTSSSRCCDSEDAKSSSFDSDPMGMFNYEYLKPEDWYQSQFSLHKGVKVQNAELSTGVDVKSLAPSIHDISPFREKPLPTLPPAARELLLRRNTTSSSTKPSSRDATDLSLHSKYSKKPQDRDSALRRPVPSRIKNPFSETSSTTSTHQRSRSSIGEQNISQALIHPAFRQHALNSSNRFATKDGRRNVPVVVACYGHNRIMSDSTQSSMVSPSKPPSSPLSSYLHSPPMSPKYPSNSFSDPLPYRSARGSPLTLVSEFARSSSNARTSLEMTDPDSPYIRRNYLPEPRRSRDGLKEYAEAIETMHGLIRDGDIDDENEDPLILKKHELLTYGDIPNPSVTKVNLTAGNNKTWPMKKKSSRLRRMSIVKLSNQGSINSSTCSFDPIQQPAEQARPVSSECSVTGEPGDKAGLASTTSLTSQCTSLEKRQPHILERSHPTGIKLSEKEHAAVMKDLQERRGIRARLLSAAMSLEKVKTGSKDVSN